MRGARWRPALAGSPVIFVLENSHFGHLKTCFSAPFAPGSLLASSIRVRHMAQRGGLIVSGGRAAEASDGGMAYSGEKRCSLFSLTPPARRLVVGKGVCLITIAVGFKPANDGILNVHDRFKFGFSVRHAARKIWNRCKKPAAILVGKRLNLDVTDAPSASRIPCHLLKEGCSHLVGFLVSAYIRVLKLALGTRTR